MRKPKISKLNEEEVISGNNNIEVKRKKEEIEEDEISRIVKKYSDTKIRFAKVNWGIGKGPYILAFEDSQTYNSCECNASGFNSLKLSDIKQDFIHIWEYGNKLPEEINKLPTLDIKKYKESLKKQKDTK